MIRPHVIVYNETSVDGRIEGFDTDPMRYYSRGFRWRSDAILMGSITALNFGAPESIEDQGRELPVPERLPIVEGFEHLVHEPRPLLVVPDSSARVRNWIHALSQPWYRAIVVLVTTTTSGEYLDYLAHRGITGMVVGSDRVDLAAALERLASEHGVQSIRTDSGGALNGALFAAGLVDELVMLVEPVLSGMPGARSVVDLPQPRLAQQLELIEVEPLDDGALWVRYRVG